MPGALRSCLAYAPALLAPLASGFKTYFPPPIKPTRYAKALQSCFYSSVTNNMLNRAVQKDKAAAMASSPSPTATIEHMLKATSQTSQKSLGGFSKYLNPTTVPPNGLSRTTALKKPISIHPSTRGLKRTSSEMLGLAATLNKADSFTDQSAAIALTRDKGVHVKSSSLSNALLDFDPNDFDDDSELDLDMEYPQVLPLLSTSREPSRPVAMNDAQTDAAVTPSKKESPEAHVPPSSIITWSSSPPSHKVTPPRALPRQQTDSANVPVESLLSEASVDAYPKPAKRKTVPWLPKRAEESQLQDDADRIEEACIGPETSCGDDRSGKRAQNYLPRDKFYPWNTTESDIKEQQRAFKNQQKKAIKDSPLSLASAQYIVKTTHQAQKAIIRLSDEQKSILDLVVNKKRSVFFTGSAGTGKSVLMGTIIDDLRKMYVREPDRVAVTASTGLAACNIGGVTLHSFGGIGLGKESASELFKKVSRNAKAKNRWIRTKVLIIDEISMVDGDLFDKLETIARLIRKDGRPFGGIQLVITGDFFQLPPVPDNNTGRAVKFAFDAGTWAIAINHTIGLTEVFRQKDPDFANMLNEMRLGKITDETVRAFRRLERPIQNEDSLEATELFPTRHEVDNANAFKMRGLIGKEYQFRAEDSGEITDIAARDKLLSNCMAPPLLTLKKGAQVMLIKNIDGDLVNGSLGRVFAFMTKETFLIYEKNSDLFETDPDGETELHDAARRARTKLKSLLNKDAVADTGKLYPVVHFTLPDGTSRVLLCLQEDWKVELPNGKVQAQRRQVPLILSWALSIHKAQGQTLQRVTVDLRKVFERGQAYVALSRATCQEGLQVKGFDKRKVMAHPRVVEFYNSLYSVSTAAKHTKALDEGFVKRVHGSEDDLMEGQVTSGTQYGFNDDEEEAMAAYG